MSTASTTRKTVFSALFAAICCAATMVPQIPTPLGGYVNCGDAIVLLSAFLLGPFWGAVAAGVGSAMADVINSYALYAPGTLVIKALMALSAGLIVRKFSSRYLRAAVPAAIAGEIIMVLGYFLFESEFLGFGLASAANIPFNCVQGVFGAAASVILYSALVRIPYVKSMLDL